MLFCFYSQNFSLFIRSECNCGRLEVNTCFCLDKLSWNTSTLATCHAVTFQPSLSTRTKCLSRWIFLYWFCTVSKSLVNPAPFLYFILPTERQRSQNWKGDNAEDKKNYSFDTVSKIKKIFYVRGIRLWSPRRDECSAVLIGACWTRRSD